MRNPYSLVYEDHSKAIDQVVLSVLEEDCPISFNLNSIRSQSFRLSFSCSYTHTSILARGRGFFHPRNNLFVCNGELFARVTFVLWSDRIRDELVLLLLYGAFIWLTALTKNVLLNVVDGCSGLLARLEGKCAVLSRTLVETILVLLALGTAACHVVGLGGISGILNWQQPGS